MPMNTLVAIVRRLCAEPIPPIPAGLPARLDPLPNVRAILFDVYGTLFVSASGDVGVAAATDRSDALTEALSAAGLGPPPSTAGDEGVRLLRREILARHDAARKNGIDFPEVEIIEIWRRVLSNLFPKRPTPETEVLRRLATEYECRVNPVCPMPELSETLNALRKNGRPLGIVSNAQFITPLLFPALLGRDLDELGFDPRLCAWSFREGRAKPSPALFEKVLDALGDRHRLAPSETVYVGNDLLNDVSCAAGAGCRTVLFAGDRRSLRLREDDPRCDGVRPDAIVTKLSQLPEILC